MPQQAVESDQHRVPIDRNISKYARKKTKAQDFAIQWQWGRRVSSQTPEV